MDSEEETRILVNSVVPDFELEFEGGDEYTEWLKLTNRLKGMTSTEAIRASSSWPAPMGSVVLEDVNERKSATSGETHQRSIIFLLDGRIFSVKVIFARL